MTKNIESDVNDLFEEEQPKKKKKVSKKELKKKKHEEEKLEKLEDEEFLRRKEENLENSIPELYLTEQFAKIEEPIQKKKEKKKKKENKDVSTFFSDDNGFTNINIPVSRAEQKKKNDDNKVSFFSLVYDTIFGFFLIIMFLLSIAYVGIDIYQKERLHVILTSATLCMAILCYVLSMIIKKDGIKKFFAILSATTMSFFIILTFYYR